MKLHESRLQADKSAIQQEIGRIAARVREAVDGAVLGLLSRDRARMYQVMLEDHEVNRATRANDRACHEFVARHIPAAGHLRWVSSVLRLNIGLERIGDYAVTICRVGVKLDMDLPGPVQDHIRSLADASSRMLELATRAFLKGDAELARDTAKMAKSIDLTHDRVFHSLVDHAEGLTLVDAIRLQTIYDKLERVSDQAKNLCEEAVFVTTGEVKPPKVYPILFLGPDGAFLAPLAAAMARRTWPKSGHYEARGVRPATAFHPSLRAIEAELDLELQADIPAPLEPLAPYPAEYHVIVTLNVPPADWPSIPFHSIHLDWSFDVPEADAPKAELVRDLQHRLRDLIEALRGKDAP